MILDPMMSDAQANPEIMNRKSEIENLRVRLGRRVRFSINPFLEAENSGCNSYTSRPAGEGLSLFLELDVELVGSAAPQTGLLVNVSDIDRAVRRHAVPVFTERVRDYLRRGEHIGFDRIAAILRRAGEHLEDTFRPARVDRLTLKLNPFRKLAMDTKEPGMLYFSEKFEFAATHKLWNDEFSEPQNRKIFGKCANPTGHGHNYLVEVTVRTPAAGPHLEVGRFEQVVDEHLMQVVDHKNLNLDVPVFRTRIPTVENIAVFAWERLAGRFDPVQLHCITVWESDRTYCSYHG
ncbi:MAG: 6-carboxytetrahydropterin synthase [Planctomycetes bacterium]|jgi:6-pyruvoyltetrahydropterin/6-carboxytetrahydropterin synthase|nr:6-carboxytetrahydropterin synthase [Planctomycetota bacterium]